VNITGKCPPSLRNKSASEVFEGCPNLVPQPNQGETLGAFFDRAAKVNTNTNPNNLAKLNANLANLNANPNTNQNANLAKLNANLAKLNANPNTNPYANLATLNANPNTNQNANLAKLNANLAKLNANQYSNPNTMLNTKPTTRKRLNRGVGSRNLTKLSIGGKKTRRNKKRKAQKTRKI